MEKFGVDEEQPGGQKQASEMATCPRCGKTLIKHGRLRLCPMHGSLPFENSDEKN